MQLEAAHAHRSLGQLECHQMSPPHSPGPRAELHHSPPWAGRIPEKRRDMSITETMGKAVNFCSRLKLNTRHLPAQASFLKNPLKSTF